MIGPAFFPRLRRELHDFARLAGCSTADSLKLALMQLAGGVNPEPKKSKPLSILQI
jgi:hypothetical protein